MKFKNSIYSALANQFLDLWTNKINTAFEKRCEDLFKLKN